MGFRLAAFVALMSVAGVTAAPLSAAALHRTCIRQVQAHCSRHSTSEGRCCVLVNITTMQPGVVAQAPQALATNAAVAVVPHTGEAVALPKVTLGTDSYLRGRERSDRPSLFVALLL
jgi:hypothetical protein